VSLRRVQRAVALVFALALNIAGYWWMRLRGPATPARRALWLQTSCSRVLNCLGIGIRVEGEAPTRGLVVSNHLSYLDILIISAAMPCTFVSKIEVDRWPYFGKAARAGGTIFLDRSSMASATSAAGEIAERLKLPVPVLLFPEGTSTDGTQVLRFHARLMEPATATGAPITAAAIRYEIEGGVEERELCWYGGDEFMPHLWKVLGVKGFLAQLRFGEPRVYADPRAAAEQTHCEVVAMRENAMAVR
jgi:lyso-ornithine lipid O-acyltransferase